MCVCVCAPGQRVPRQHLLRREQSHQDLQDVHPAVQGQGQIRQWRVQVEDRLHPQHEGGGAISPRPISRGHHETVPTSSVVLRFRHGYCKGNPRKMVRTWAEKEMRNLIRSEPHGVRTVRLSPREPHRVITVLLSPLEPHRVRTVRLSPLEPHRVRTVRLSPLEPHRIRTVRLSPLEPHRVRTVRQSTRTSSDQNRYTESTRTSSGQNCSTESTRTLPDQLIEPSRTLPTS